MKYGHNVQNTPTRRCSEGPQLVQSLEGTVIFLDILEMFAVPAIARQGFKDSPMSNP